MAKLSNDWLNAFRYNFENEEDIIEFIFENLDTKSWEDSYIDMGGYGEPNECFKQTVGDKKNLLYEFIMSLINK